LTAVTLIYDVRQLPHHVPTVHFVLESNSGLVVTCYGRPM